MKIKFGENLKRIRKKRGITQEQLAAHLGISFQAVSKWEREESYPDITFIPIIASYFGTSADELLGYSLAEERAEIERLCDEAERYKESVEGFIKGKEIIERGLAKYPDNDILLNEYLYYINYSNDPDDTILFATKLLKRTENKEFLYNAYRFIAYAYNAKGDSSAAIEYLEKIPQLYFSQLSEMAFVLDGEAKFNAASKQKWASIETLVQMMWKLTECYESEGAIENAIKEVQRALDLLELFSYEKEIANFDNYISFLTSHLDRLQSQ